MWAPQGRTRVLQPLSRLCLRAQRALQRRDMRFMTDVAADALQQPTARVRHHGVGAQGGSAKASLEHHLRLEYHLRQVSMRQCRADYLRQKGSLDPWIRLCCHTETAHSLWTQQPGSQACSPSEQRIKCTRPCWAQSAAEVRTCLDCRQDLFCFLWARQGLLAVLLHTCANAADRRGASLPHTMSHVLFPQQRAGAVLRIKHAPFAAGCFPGRQASLRGAAWGP